MTRPADECERLIDQLRMDEAVPFSLEEATLLELAEHVSSIAASDPARAAECAAVVATSARRADAPRAEARSLRAASRALAFSGQLDDALASARAAIEVAECAGEPIEAARARLASMHALGELGRLDEAIDAGERARRSLVAVGEVMLAARADVNIGIARHRRDDAEGAVQAFERARGVLETDPFALGHLENSRGEALVALNRFEEAEHSFTAARRAFDRADSGLNAAIAEGNLADLALRQGRLHVALRSFERARRLFESADAPAHAARVLAEQAEAKDLVGLVDDALREFGEALETLDQLGLPLEAARARAGMGRVLARSGRLGEAETALAAAASGFDRLDHVHARLRVDLDRAGILMWHDRLDEALTLAQHALATLIDRPLEAAMTRLLLARIWHARGNIEVASAELSAGVALARELDVAPLIADFEHLRGDLELERGAANEAVQAYTLAVTAVERIRGLLQGDRFRSALVADRASAHAGLIRALAARGEPGDDAQAFDVSERGRSRTLLDQVGSALSRDEHDRRDQDGRDDALMRRLQRGREALHALYAAAADDALVGRDVDALRRWQNAVRSQEMEVDEVESRLATTDHQLHLVAGAATADEVLRGLAPGEVVVSYYVAGDDIMIFALADGVLTRRAVSFDGNLHRAIRDLRFEIDAGLSGAPGPPRIDSILETLSAALLAPIASAIEGADLVTVIPFGAIHSVPLAALPFAGAPLIGHACVRVLPSASVGARLAAHAPATGAPLILAADDEYAPAFRAEALGVARRLGVAPDRVLTGDDALVERYRSGAPDAALIHIAGHGRISRSTPLASGIRLADRWLTIRDILQTPIGADLVVLSGCETGAHDERAGDEVIGPGRAFIAAGARSAVVSQWRVRDDWGKTLMDVFYDCWHTGRGRGAKVAALRSAQLAIRERESNPAAWAAFQLLGDP